MRTVSYSKGGVVGEPKVIRAPEAIGSVIVKNKYRVIAEIGIHVCSMSDQVRGYVKKKWFGEGSSIPTEMPIDEYWMIDPWPYGYKCGSLGGDKVDNARWDSYYHGACKRMVIDKSCRVLRLTSVESAKLFPNEYFDLVYIDADHKYESVTEDITVWLPKVRAGGAITGHDYSGGWGEVVRAVDDFFIKRSGKEVKKFFQIDGGDKHYRMDSGVWVVEL